MAGGLAGKLSLRYSRAAGPGGLLRSCRVEGALVAVTSVWLAGWLAAVLVVLVGCLPACLPVCVAVSGSE